MAAETPYDNVTNIVVSEVVEDENGKELKSAGETPVVAEGECGDNLLWSLDEKRVLSISGTGKMYDYYSSNAPWYEYRSEIKKIELNVGITKIGAYAFSGCMATGDLIIPNGVTGTIVIPENIIGIGPESFTYCTNIEKIVFENSKIEIDIENSLLPEQAIISGYQNSTAYTYAVEF